MLAELTSPRVGRPKTETHLETPDDTTRVPARISKRLYNRLREHCLIELRRPIEVVIGEWIEDRIRRDLESKSRKR
jgi:hypothetical protein